MDVRRLFRTTPAALAAAAMLTASGCSSGPGDRGDGPSAADREQSIGNADAAPLKALPAAVPGELKKYYGQQLNWHKCGAVGFECATLRVPLDYDKPDPDQDLELAVSRKSASGGGKHLGSLVVNPGGPGGSAVEYLQQAAGIGYPAKVRGQYDIVGMDPRGVARSEPVTCMSDARMDSFTRTDQTPDDAGERGELVAGYEEFAKGCKEKSGDVLAHVSTEDSARDMDLLRAALGDDKLHYVGASYGTYLGATYAGLFPGRSGRMVLDGAMDPSLSMEQLNRDQTRGFETAFRAFAKDCADRKDCPLGDDAGQVGKELKAFFTRIDKKPVNTTEDRDLTESLATTAVIRAMYDESSWPRLRDAVTAAKDGDGTDLLTLSDEYYERDPDGSYGNIMFANPAVNCLDLPPAFSGPAEVEKALPSFRKASPVFGEGFAWAALNCGYWQEKPSGEPHRIAADGADPILVVGTTRDPATPYKWAEGLSAQLSSGRLLTYDGDGHTAYLRGGACIDGTINDYLLNGKAPEDGKKCG